MKSLKFSKNKNIFLLLIIIAGVTSVIYILSLTKKKTQPTITENEKAPYPTINIDNSATSGGAYYLNVVQFSNTNVSGYSWTSDGNIYYSTSEGIFLLPKNTHALATTIKSISWSQGGYALYTNGLKWYLFQPQNTTPLEINYAFNNPKISPNAKYVIDYHDKELILYDLDTKIENKYTDNSKIESAFVSQDSNFVAIYNTDKNLTILSTTLKLTNKTSTSDNEEPISLSYDGNLYLTKTPNAFFIKNLDNQPIAQFNTSSNSKILITWLDKDNLILTEGVTDQFKRITNYFYAINVRGSKTYLANDQPIIGKINSEISYAVNPDGNVLLMTENRGKLWFLSLAPNYLPTLGENGLVFTFLPPKDHEEVDDKGI